MTPELAALYQLHRYQIILNAKDAEGKYRFPTAFLYAVAKDVYPLFHEQWCGGNDPYLDCYSVTKDFIAEVAKYVDDLWLKKMPTPTFYELEEKFGHGKRVELVHIMRYCYLDDLFGPAVYKTLLKATEYPIEAGSLADPFSEGDLLLL